MESEALATLKLMVSPTAAAEAVKGHVTSRPTAGGSKDDDGVSVAPRGLSREAQTAGGERRRRRRTAEQRKTVRFAETEDRGAHRGGMCIR